jgi:hypothetical protein
MRAQKDMFLIKITIVRKRSQLVRNSLPSEIWPTVLIWLANFVLFSNDKGELGS